MKPLICATILWVFFPAWALSAYLPGAAELSAEGAAFTWEEAKSKSLKILIEYQDHDKRWKQASLGSGFLISPDGLFVTAYHVMKYCLESQKERSRFSTGINCSAEHPVFRYKARNGDAAYEIEMISYSYGTRFDQRQEDANSRRDHQAQGFCNRKTKGEAASALSILAGARF